MDCGIARENRREYRFELQFKILNDSSKNKNMIFVKKKKQHWNLPKIIIEAPMYAEPVP